jgi:sphingolipid C9-methyltransferase
MVYTGGIRLSENDTLAQMQYQKIELVCRKIQLQQGHRLLDIGCGWGSLTLQATKNYGVRGDAWGCLLLYRWSSCVVAGKSSQAQCTGVTLSSEQVRWAEEVAARRGISCPRFLRMDYRDIPKEKFNRVTCLEMAEHVGVKNFTTFLLQVRGGFASLGGSANVVVISVFASQVRELLEDDGIFFMQIAGLRRLWQFEDLTWCASGGYAPGLSTGLNVNCVSANVPPQGFVHGQVRFPWG